MLISFEEYNKKEKELSEYKKKILKLIDEFISIDKEFRTNHNNVSDYLNATDFYDDDLRNRKHVIRYTSKSFGYGEEYQLTHKEYSRLLKFMEDPELYKATNQYNL